MSAVSPTHRTMILSFASALLLASCSADTTTAKQPRTLLGKLPIAALHIDETAGTAPVNGESSNLIEVRFSFAHCRLPSITLTAMAHVHVTPQLTTYSVGSNGFHPKLSVEGSGWELAKRWRDSSIFHPMLALGVGSLTARYSYYLTNSSGSSIYKDERSSTTYYTPSIGIEASLFRYVSLYTLIGSRFAGDVNLPGVNPGAFNGQYVVAGMGFGKFR